MLVQERVLHSHNDQRLVFFDQAVDLFHATRAASYVLLDMLMHMPARVGGCALVSARVVWCCVPTSAGAVLVRMGAP